MTPTANRLACGTERKGNVRMRKRIASFTDYVGGMTSRLRHLAGFGPAPSSQSPSHARGPVTHVIILDGTMSSLEEGFETNAGQVFRLMQREARTHPISLHYEAGIQWQGFRRAVDVMAGVGINRQIRRAYGVIASRYRPGDKIFLFGYSRGAYAVRSLAGVIDRIGLLKAEAATERYVREAYRHYRRNPDSPIAQTFRDVHCHQNVEIAMIGVWDTVRALGFRAPVLWRFSPEEHTFHDHSLGCTVRHGYHALAHDETRRAFEPVLWTSKDGYSGVLEQVWFRGTHGDVGGHLLGYEAARPLANLSLVWMLEKAEALGLPMPMNWPAHFPCDPDAPSVGMNRGWGKLFQLRRRRTVGTDTSERLHSSVSPSMSLRDRIGSALARLPRRPFTKRT